MHEETDLCVIGGGPAGMMAGLIFARAGVRTTVLEKHADFLRDFRGDTVHPSTLRLFAELGSLERLLERPHDKVPDIGAYIGGRYFRFADFSGFDPRWNFVAMMPQWEFLDFVASEARRFPGFKLLMESEAVGLIQQGARVAGVRYRKGGRDHKIRSKLVIASDGRRSVVREEAGLPLRSFSAPMDVFWFRLPKERGLENDSTGVFAGGRIIALIDRGDYWQCAYVFGKGLAEEVRARGLDAFRKEVAEVAPMVADRVAAIRSWDDVKLLTVSVDRLERWHRPGLLVIGDAAHAMSPIGGIGINVAVQDAVAAANILARPMAKGENPDPLLAKVQKRRLPAVSAMQAFQVAAQKRIIGRLLAARGPVRPAPAIRLLDRFAPLRAIPAILLGFGIRAEHVRSPKAGP